MYRNYSEYNIVLVRVIIKQKKIMTLYFNKNNNLFSILKTNYETSVITITDKLGEIVKSMQQNSYKSTIDFNDLSSGMYLVTVNTNGTTDRKLVII